MSQKSPNPAVDTAAPEATIETERVISAPTESTRELDEYKLAVQVLQNYHEVALKSITIMVAITAISLGFVFRESVSTPLKVTFCWFNLVFSLFFSLCFLGFLSSCDGSLVAWICLLANCPSHFEIIMR
jgi:hypothetical protein